MRRQTATTRPDGGQDASSEDGDKAPLGRLRVLGRFLLPYRATVGGALLALIAAAAATLGIGLAIRRIVDYGLSTADSTFIDNYFLALLAVAAVLAAATFARFYLVSWLGERVVADIRAAVYDNLLRLHVGFFDYNRPGEIASRLVSDLTVIQTIIGSSASVALRNLLLLTGGIALLVITSPKLTGLVVLMVPVVVLPIVIFGRRVRKLSRHSQDRIADVSSRAGEILGAIRTVFAFGQQDRESRAFRDDTEAAFRVAVDRIRARAWLTAFVILIVFGAIDFVMWSGAKDMASGVMSGGELAAFLFYAIMVAGAFGALSEVYGDLQRAAGAATRISELLAVRSEISTPASPRALPEPAVGRIAFENVSFSYPGRPGERALNNLSFVVNPGETVAIVGPSGAGKSTVFQLLLRFYDCLEGRITLDGVDIAEADPLAVRRRLALVPQESVIFNASARDNLSYGSEQATDAALDAAIRAAAADDFLARLPDGLDSGLGERGSMLSGGERQRVAIARALLRNAPVLLLDEATSSLDAESETRVQGAFANLMEGRTTLVIAHRLATVKRADRIVVIEQGHLVASGTHEALVAEGGLYARLARLQFQDAAPGSPG